jgi:hypothetical protein
MMKWFDCDGYHQCGEFVVDQDGVLEWNDRYIIGKTHPVWDRGRIEAEAIIETLHTHIHDVWSATGYESLKTTTENQITTRILFAAAAMEDQIHD